MRKILIFVVFVISLTVQAANYSEKNQYLGVVNGQVVGNSVVKVTRTPTEPILYQTANNSLPAEELIIRQAQSRPASGGQINITVKKILKDGQYAYLTLKASLMVDGLKQAITASQRGDDVVINVPAAIRQVELRTDAPVELEFPTHYRGNLQIQVEVEGIKAI